MHLLLVRAGFMRAFVFRIVSAFLVVTVLAACTDSDHRVVLHTGQGDYTFTVEIADDNAERQKGLMFRQELASDAGMLFDFHEERQVAFWMQNTFIPLDMVFVKADGTVQNVHPNARPQDPTSIPSDGPVRFVLEIPGGRAAEIGLKAGDRLENPRVGN